MLENSIILLAWITALCIFLLCGEGMFHFIRYLINRKVLITKRLSVHSSNTKLDN